MLFNPLKDVDPFRVCTRLYQYPEFNKTMDRKIDIMRYIALVYDKESPLQKELSMLKKKIEALNALDIDPQSKFGMSLIRNASSDINAMVVQYCRMQHQLDFTKLIMTEQALYFEYFNLQDEQDSLARQRIISNINKLDTSLRELSATIFGGIREPDLEKQMLDMIEGEIDLRLRPEDMVVKTTELEEITYLYPNISSYEPITRKPGRPPKT